MEWSGGPQGVSQYAGVVAPETCCDGMLCTCRGRREKTSMPFEFQTKNIRNDISNIDMSMGGVGMVVLHHKHTQGVAHPIGNHLLRHGVLCIAVEPPLKTVGAV